MTPTADSSLPGQLHPVQTPGRAVAAVHRPQSVVQALQLLADDPDRLPLAGGTDLLLDLHRGGVGPSVEVVDLTAIADFDSIEETSEELVLSGGVRHGQVIADDRFIRYATPLAQACLEIGSPQLRNRATIAGNLATASPANDTLSALLALGAAVELSTWDGAAVQARRVAVADFFTGFRATVLQPNELITRIVVPKLRANQRGLWVKLGNRRAQAISVIHAAFVVDIDDGIVSGATVAVGSMAATVMLVPGIGAALAGTSLDSTAITAAADAARNAFEPIDDVRATAQYRRDAVESLVTRSLLAIRDQQHRSQWPEVVPGLHSALSHVPQTARTVVTDNTAISMNVNGGELSGDGASSANLLDWLRNAGAAVERTLDGTKEGCAEGECGACTVQLNGAAVMACIVQAAQADGGTVVTVEGLATTDEGLHPIQQAFIDEFAVQCGYCIPGFLMAGCSLVDEVPNPTDEQIKLGLSGNLCRCTGYYPIIQAVKSAAERLASDRLEANR
ncbi:MAG: hypothetical protein HKN03_10885 [Acidimicrobiales bacterium]|nr:hypothetical protein [Acidimicrobiales bacterium]